MGIDVGALAVRRSILIEAPPERVWREFETYERMRAWFGTGHRLLEYEPRVGGSVVLEIDYEPKGHGNEPFEGDRIRRFGGKVLVFEPEREVTFESDWIPNEGDVPPSFITLRLTPALGGTLVELFNHLSDEPGQADHLQGIENGWNMRHLNRLRAIVEG